MDNVTAKDKDDILFEIVKAQTALLRSIDNYSSNLPYMRTGIDSMVNQGVRIKP